MTFSETTSAVLTVGCVCAALAFAYHRGQKRGRRQGFTAGLILARATMPATPPPATSVTSVTGIATASQPHYLTMSNGYTTVYPTDPPSDGEWGWDVDMQGPVS